MKTKLTDAQRRALGKLTREWRSRGLLLETFATMHALHIRHLVEWRHGGFQSSQWRLTDAGAAAQAELGN